MQISDDKAETIAGLKAVLKDILDLISANYRHAVRAVHAKSYGRMKARLAILPNLPLELRPQDKAIEHDGAAGHRTAPQKIPGTLEELMELPNVSIKVADIMMNFVFMENSIAVDTHVLFVLNRLGIIDTIPHRKRQPSSIAKRRLGSNGTPVKG